MAPTKRNPYDGLAKLSPSQKAELDEIEAKAIVNFEGTIDELEAAIGMLRLGHHFGWKILYLVHSKRTIRKYEAILDIKIRELFEERGPGSYRSRALDIVDTLSNFWKVVSGEEKVEGRREIKKR